MSSNVRVGGVDEPARSTDVFYGLALPSRGPLILTRERQRNAIRRVPARTDRVRPQKNSVIVADSRGKVNALERGRRISF